MSRASVIALVLAGILIGCAAGVVAHEALEPEATAQGIYMGQKWEHKCTYRKATELSKHEVVIAETRELGAQGWQMVATAQVGQSEIHAVCFKRPIP